MTVPSYRTIHCCKLESTLSSIMGYRAWKIYAETRSKQRLHLYNVRIERGRRTFTTGPILEGRDQNLTVAHCRQDLQAPEELPRTRRFKKLLAFLSMPSSFSVLASAPRRAVSCHPTARAPIRRANRLEHSA